MNGMTIIDRYIDENLEDIADYIMRNTFVELDEIYTPHVSLYAWHNAECDEWEVINSDTWEANGWELMAEKHCIEEDERIEEYIREAHNWQSCG